MNCHNCGAPRQGPSCPYCGTRFEDMVEETDYYSDGRLYMRVRTDLLTGESETVIFGEERKWT